MSIQENLIETLPNPIDSDEPIEAPAKFREPTPFPLPNFQLSNSPRPLDAEQKTKLDSLTAHFDTPGLALPFTLKELKAYRKRKGYKSPMPSIRSDSIQKLQGEHEKSASEQSSAASSINGEVMENDWEVLSDWEKCWLSTEREFDLAIIELFTEDLNCDSTV